MTDEELKKKIVEILDNNIRWQPYYYISRGIVYEDDLKNIADALIEAGLKLDRNISYTATLNLAQLERINDLEKRLAKAAHRAEVAEQKATAWKDCANKWQKYYKEQAEREIKEKKGE